MLELQLVLFSLILSRKKFFKLKKYFVNKCVLSKLETEFWIFLAITLNSLFSSAKTDSHLLVSFPHQFLPT